MEIKNINCNNKEEYKYWLSTIIKDIEIIMIYVSSFNEDKKVNLLIKLKLLKESLINKREKNISEYENDNITITDEYLIIHCLNCENAIEINENMDVVIGTEYINLIKRNMKDFYFYNRKVVYEIEEGSFISKKLEAKWNKEHYELKNKSILCEKMDIDIDTLLDSKVYTKGSKK